MDRVIYDILNDLIETLNEEDFSDDERRKIYEVLIPILEDHNVDCLNARDHDDIFNEIVEEYHDI